MNNILRKKSILTREVIEKDYYPKKAISKKDKEAVEDIRTGRMQILVEKLAKHSQVGKQFRLEFENGAVAIINALTEDMVIGAQFYVITPIAGKYRHTYVYPVETYELTSELSKFCAATIVATNNITYKPSFDKETQDAINKSQSTNPNDKIVEATNVPYFGDIVGPAMSISYASLAQHQILPVFLWGGMCIVGTLGFCSVVGFSMSNFLFSLIWGLPLGIVAAEMIKKYIAVLKRKLTITHEIIRAVNPPEKLIDKILGKVVLITRSGKKVPMSRKLAHEDDMHFYLLSSAKPKVQFIFPCEYAVLDAELKAALVKGPVK